MSSEEKWEAVYDDDAPVVEERSWDKKRITARLGNLLGIWITICISGSILFGQCPKRGGKIFGAFLTDLIPWVCCASGNDFFFGGGGTLYSVLP